MLGHAATRNGDFLLANTTFTKALEWAREEQNAYAVGLLEDGQKLLNETCKQRGVHVDYCLSKRGQIDGIRPAAIEEESTSAIENVVVGDSEANIEEA